MTCSAWCILVSSSQVFSSFRAHAEAGHHSTWPAMLPVRSESKIIELLLEARAATDATDLSGLEPQPLSSSQLMNVEE